jgi:chromosome segregation ATPase
MQNEIIAAEAKFQHSVNEVMSMTKTSDGLIANLQKELQNKNLKLSEYDKTNEILTAKLKKSDKMVEHLHNIITQESNRKVDMDKFIMNHKKVINLIKDKNDLIEQNSSLQNQLMNLEKNNNKAQLSLNKMHEENQYLEVCINNLKRENERMASNIDKPDSNVNLGLKYNELIDKVEKISKHPNQKRVLTDTMIRGLEKEIKCQKDKVHILSMK